MFERAPLHSYVCGDPILIESDSQIIKAQVHEIQVLFLKGNVSVSECLSYGMYLVRSVTTISRGALS